MTFVEQVQALLEQTEAIGTDVVNVSAEEVAVCAVLPRMGGTTPKRARHLVSSVERFR